MQLIKDEQFTHITLSPSKSKVRSERAEVIKFFVDHLKNKEGKPYPARLIAVKLSHIPTKDLYYLKSTCSQAKNFNSCFWGSLKVK